MELLKTSNRKLFGKISDICKLNTTLPKPWVKEMSQNTGYFELNENENTTCANLGDTAKVVVRETCIGLNSCLKKKKGFKPITSVYTLRN